VLQPREPEGRAGVILVTGSSDRRVVTCRASDVEGTMRNVVLLIAAAVLFLGVVAEVWAAGASHRAADDGGPVFIISNAL